MPCYVEYCLYDEKYEHEFVSFFTRYNCQHENNPNAQPCTVPPGNYP